MGVAEQAPPPRLAPLALAALVAPARSAEILAALDPVFHLSGEGQYDAGSAGKISLVDNVLERDQRGLGQRHGLSATQQLDIELRGGHDLELDLKDLPRLLRAVSGIAHRQVQSDPDPRAVRCPLHVDVGQDTRETLRQCG